MIVASLTVIAGAWRARFDVTSEQIHSLSPDTRKLLSSLDPKRPVLIQAYLSPDVPRSYLEVKNNLLAFLREFDAVGAQRVETRVVETVKYSPEAREARERYSILPFRVTATEESAQRTNEIFLGLVFTCGTEEFVIPQFDRGLPVEYELMRSIRVVPARRAARSACSTPARVRSAVSISRPSGSRTNGRWSPSCASNMRWRRSVPTVTILRI